MGTNNNARAPLAYARTQLGRTGEKLAAQYLEENGWEILATNYSGRGFELDIVAEKDGTTAVVEVRTRRGTPPTFIAESITPDKVRSLRRGASQWLAATGERTQLRFDVVVVSVRGNRAHLHHYPDVK